MKLEELEQGKSISGILAGGSVTVVSVTWHGTNAVELTYKDSTGRPGVELIYREQEPFLKAESTEGEWEFSADGNLFKLVSESLRIKLGYLFDPYLAVNSSDVEPLPHQITAVYEKMLSMQPLRFLLADDPGAGKTIMAGLLIKELLLRGDVERCMVVCPGNLVEQWQDELDSKFSLPFEILTNDKLESARSGNWFLENDLVISRLDKLSRDDALHPKLENTDWDLIIVDEAHKMSATFFGGEVKYTKRYRLGQLLSRITRHFLLLTATPHNGKEEDFQLFLSLIDEDRFEGKFRTGVRKSVVTDIMRRMVKEQLVKFDGKPLFPERRAYTVQYELSEGESQLYQAVTNYVRTEFNRASLIGNEGARRNIGFALTILQRRLASSPAAIYHSLKRRRERLEAKIEEIKSMRDGKKRAFYKESPKNWFSVEDIEDLEDAPESEVEELEDEIIDRATSAQNITELKKEVAHLTHLETLAKSVFRRGEDKKWEELSSLLQENESMFDRNNIRRKLVIFTEHKDTLVYLKQKVSTLLGNERAIVTIYGGMNREERKKAEGLFKHDSSVAVLIATDAAGEGINLQRAHLMVNYDLPWNPNRLEQRFGRIHRIGQTEVCHLWNLVAHETREGQVFVRLLSKLQVERDDLKGKVFDVLGQIFQGQALRDLLIEAIMYGESPETRAKLEKTIDTAMDPDKIRALLESEALSQDTLSSSKIQDVRDMMERAKVRKLQPHFIHGYFKEAFTQLGGKMRKREQDRYELTHVPADIRNRMHLIGGRRVILHRYERVTFNREAVSLPGAPAADLLSPGHPLLDGIIDLYLERYRQLLSRGAILVDDVRPEGELRVLCYLEHTILDGRPDRHGNRLIASKRVQFLEIVESGEIHHAGYAPFLEYRCLGEDETEQAAGFRKAEWLHNGFRDRAVSYAIANLVPVHLEEVRLQRETIVKKSLSAVKERLTREIHYWDNEAERLRLQEKKGKVNAKINSTKARKRAEDLVSRLKKRTEELEQQRKLSPQPPVVLGGCLVLPAGMLPGDEKPGTALRQNKESEQTAMDTIMSLEREMGNYPEDVSALNRGWDIESRNPETGLLRFIEVKGRQADAQTVTITKNEIRQGLNNPENYFLAVVLIQDGVSSEVYYVREPYETEPDWGVASRNYQIKELLSKGKKMI